MGLAHQNRRMSSSAAFTQGWLMMAGLIVAIGAQNALVLRQGLARAHVGAVVALCTVSDIVLVVAGVYGLGALAASSPGAMSAMRFGGAAFLLWCAWRAARRAWLGTGALDDRSAGGGLATTLATTAALTWLNPHVYLDTVLLVGSLSAGYQGAARIAYGAGAALASFVWFFGLGYGARLLQPVFARQAAWRVLDVMIAVVMTAIAIGLLV